MVEAGLKQKIQAFGRVLSGMVMPNIGAFIAWGLITALFIPTGWAPNAKLANLVGPMITYLLPLLIAYTGGKMFGGTRGGVIASIATMGIVIGSTIPMFLGAMLVGPLSGWIIKKFDNAIEGKIPAGFEMLVSNYGLGIIGMLLALIAYLGIGPAVDWLSSAMETGVNWIMKMNFLPFVSILVEPAKILFLNNAVNHGVLEPIGLSQVHEFGKSLLFLIETNPGPGLGILLAYWMFSKRTTKASAPGAIIIHFFGGIHEIYFPYVLMNPALILAVIGGGMSGVFTFKLFNSGLTAGPSPGSIFALLSMAPKSSIVGVLIGVAVSTGVSLLIAAPFVKRSANRQTDEDFTTAQNTVAAMKQESKNIEKTISVIANEVKEIVYACDAGMGSSAMGAGMLKKRLKKNGYDIAVKHYAINEIPTDAVIVVTHEQLANRAKTRVPNANIILVKDFLDMSVAETVIGFLK